MAKKVQNQSSAFGIASLTCSIVAWLAFGIVLAPAAIVFGIVGLARDEKNKGLAIAGLVIGSVGFVVLIYSLAIISAARSVLY